MNELNPDRLIDAIRDQTDNMYQAYGDSLPPLQILVPSGHRHRIYAEVEHFLGLNEGTVTADNLAEHASRLGLNIQFTTPDNG